MDSMVFTCPDPGLLILSLDTIAVFESGSGNWHIWSVSLNRTDQKGENTLLPNRFSFDVQNLKCDVRNFYRFSNMQF